MQPTARIRLLGQFDLRLDGQVVPPLDSARAESLLAFLLLNRNVATPRQRVEFQLWPDSTETQAQTNLRHVLHTLRRHRDHPADPEVAARGTMLARHRCVRDTSRATAKRATAARRR